MKSSQLINNALIYRQFGDPKQVLQLDYSLKLAPSDFVVKMLAAPINPSDLIPITGAYRHRIPLPVVAGYEGVGIVTKSKDKSLIGKRVLPLRGSGTWQNYVNSDPKWAVIVPDFIENDVASRGYINPLAAYLMLEQNNVSNKCIMITAAGSTCANILIQLAQQLGVKKIVSIYRSSSHLSELINMGTIPISINDTENITNYASTSDFVFDAVGGDLATLLLQTLPQKSKFISYGLLSGKPFIINHHGVLPIRFYIRDYFSTMTVEQWHNYFNNIWLRLNKLQQPKVTYFDLTDWRLALDHFNQTGRRTKPIFLMS